MELNYYNPFLLIDEYKFQELCRDILGKQRAEGITTCRLYESRGIAQYGADVLANCDDGHSVDIGQCKRRSKFSAAEIIDASDKFLMHLDTHWKAGYTVRRFVLMVACRLERKKQHEEIQRQTERFSSICRMHVCSPSKSAAGRSSRLISRARPDREANAARASAMPLREQAACAMFFNFVRIETNVSLALSSCRSVLTCSLGTGTSGSHPSLRNRARAAASALSVFFFDLAMTPKRISINDADAADVTLHLVVEVVDILRGLDRHLILHVELLREACQPIAGERISL
jgi:hypothetical protein